MAWGNNGKGQVTIPADLTGVTTIAAGWSFSLALKNDGSIVAWGNGDSGQTTTNNGLSAVAIAGGGSHAIAITANGEVQAWGSNAYGQTSVPLGLASPAPHGAVTCQTPVAAGGSSTCTITPEPGYELASFSVNGVDALAQVTNGTYQLKNILVNQQVTASFEISVAPHIRTGVQAVATGGAHNVALLHDGTVVAWGANTYNQSTVPSELKGVTAIAAGDNHTLALREDGTVVAWGRNLEGQATVPTTLNGVQAIAAGDTFSIALKTDGSTVAWGKLDGGNLPAPFSGVKAIAAGARHILAIKNDGTVVTAGANFFGVLTVPTGLTDVQQIAAGEDYSLALKSDGTVQAWGKNTAQQTNIPSGVSSVKTIAAGRACALALKTDGQQVWIWGDATNPQINKPAGLSGLAQIAAGREQALALKEDGHLIPWGLPNETKTIPTGVTESYGLPHGFIDCLPQVVIDNSTNVCTITPDPEHRLASWTVNGVDQFNSVSLNKYTLANIQVPTTISASFALIYSGPSKPGAPSITKLTPGPDKGQVAVDFSKPAADGDSPITEYTVTSSPGGKTATGSISPLIVTGLTIGTEYTFTVQAKNAAGSGPLSVVSSPIKPATVPDAPAITTVTPGNGQLTVAFTAPAFNGGNDITVYTVTTTPGNQSTTGTVSPIEIPNLTNGTTYTVTVKATNTWGASLPSPAVTATPATVPDAPAITTVTPGNGQAVVAFTAPASNGGSPISEYTVTSSPEGKTGSGVSSPITVPGLSNGTTYTFTAQAKNIIGAGPSSGASASVTPGPVPPAAPSIQSVTAGNGQITVSFNPPLSDGGSVVTTYQASTSPGGIKASVAADKLSIPPSITIPGLSNGTTYTVAVVAINDKGSGAASAPSNPVTPATMPPAPTITEIIPNSGQLTVAFTPVSDGGSPINEYQVICTLNGEKKTASGPTSPLIVTGLSNGVSYGVQVMAKNAMGWGSLSPAQAATPQPNYQATVTGHIKIKALAAGSTHTVALMEDGTVRSWGDTPKDSFVVKPTNLGKVKAVAASHGPQSAAGNWNIVALEEDGAVRVWGDDSLGQVSTMPADLGKVKAIAAGDQFVVAVKEDGTVVSWGDDLSLRIPSLPKPEDLSGVKSVATGRSHILALKEDGTVVAWGLNHVGQAEVPAGLSGVKAIAGGWANSLALKDTGEIKGWGQNGSGQLDIPTNLPPSQITAIAAGMTHSAALLQDGTVKFWGSNGTSQATIPQEIEGWDIKTIALGDNYSIVLNDEGTPFAFGVQPFNAVPEGINIGTAYGSIPSPCAKSADGTATCTAIPMAGYVLSSLTINNENIALDQVIDNKYSFDLSENKTVTATFDKIGASPLPIKEGWNLLGAWGPIDPSQTFADQKDQKTYTSLWQWLNGNWAVRLPPNDDAGAKYAEGKGFTLLTSIEAGSGFWLNSAAETEVGISYSPAPTAKVPPGWNLLATDGSATVSANKMVQDFSDGTIISIWKWEDNIWAVYLPGTPDEGQDYAASKGFNHLTVIKPGEGYWLNVGE